MANRININTSIMNIKINYISTEIELIEVLKQIEWENEPLPNDFVNVMDSINAILEGRGYEENSDYTYDVRQQILDRYEDRVLNKQGLSFN